MVSRHGDPLMTISGFGNTLDKIEIIDDTDRGTIASPKTGVSFFKPLKSVIANSSGLPGALAPDQSRYAKPSKKQYRTSVGPQSGRPASQH